MGQVARLATAGGARASLSHVIEQAFLVLASELERQGVTKSVIADMFGMTPRTYHRRVCHARRQYAARRTLSEAVLELVRASQPISAHAVQQHFLRHPGELVAGALNDLIHSGVATRRGWGDTAVYRLAPRTGDVRLSELRQGEPVRHVRVARQRR
jgi:hypothetical protein